MGLSFVQFVPKYDLVDLFKLSFILNRAAFVAICLAYSTLCLATELPQTFTLDGQLLRVGTDQPLLDSNVKITVLILDPSKTCLLYEEEQNVDTNVTGGYYNIQIGSDPGDSKRTVRSPVLTMAQIFQNRVTIAATDLDAPSVVCVGGATYSPASKDMRYFRLVVTPSDTNLPDTLLPDTVLDSVPQALVAQTLQGLSPADFLQVGTGDLSQTNLQTIFSSGNATKLSTLLSTDPSLYITKDGTNGTVRLPASSSPTSPLTGQIWYDSGSIKFWDGSGEKTLGVTGGTLPVINGGTGVTSLPSTFILNGGQPGSVSLGATDANSVTISTSNSPRISIDSFGKVGVGTATPQSVLDVNGEVRLGNSAVACTATNEGALRYDSSTKTMVYCNGTTWMTLDPGGRTSCPAGYNLVGTQGAGAFCISNEKAAATYDNALNTCYSETVGKARICNYSEWYIGCRDGMPNATDNEEWVNDAAYFDQILVVGNGSCISKNFHPNTYATPSFRCCIR